MEAPLAKKSTWVTGLLPGVTAAATKMALPVGKTSPLVGVVRRMVGGMGTVSVSRMVTTARGAARVALTGTLRLMKKRSVFSVMLSPMILMVMGFVVSPGAKVSVLLVAM